MFFLINPASADPRNNSFPLGLAYIAGSMKLHGAVRIFDLHCKPEENTLIECLVREDVRFVGITACSDYFYEVVRLARMVKAFAPSAVVGIGGPHATFQSREVLDRYLEIDMTMIGSGELAAERLAANLSAGKKDWYTGVPNIAYRLQDKQVIFSDFQRSWYSVRPAREIFPSLTEYAISRGIDVPILSMDTSRGCHGTCSFCMLKVDQQPRWRCRDLSDFGEELLYVTQGLPDKSIDLYLTDADLLASVKRLPHILSKIRKTPAVRYFIASARTDSVCRASEYLEELFAAGLSILELGIESASQSQLDRYGKQTSMRVHEQALHLLLPLEQKYHAKIGIDLIPFDPFVTISELQEIDHFMERFFYKKAGYEDGLFIKTTLYPGTDLYARALAVGLISDDRGGQPSYWRFYNDESAQVYRKVSAFQTLVYPSLRDCRKKASKLAPSLQGIVHVSDYAAFLKYLRFLNEAPYQAFHQATFSLDEPARVFLDRMQMKVEQACGILQQIIERFYTTLPA